MLECQACGWTGDEDELELVYDRETGYKAGACPQCGRDDCIRDDEEQEAA